MKLIIVLDPELGASPREFAAAWNADPEYSAQGLLEERQPGQTFDASLANLFRDALDTIGPNLSYLSAATTIIINGVKLVKFIREKFGNRVDIGEVETVEKKAGDKTVHAVIKSKEKKSTGTKNRKKKK
jgi:hypothetical protein